MFFILSIFQKCIGLASTTLVIYAFLSWIPGGYSSWFGRIIVRLVEPLLAPFRKFSFQMGGFDWTVFVAILTLNLLNRFITTLMYSLFM